ncbi:MAG: hypothetical protein ACLSHC_01505 [Bilophila wadsworthia]
MTEAHGSGKKGMRWLPFLLVLSLCAALLGCQVEVYRGLTEAQVNTMLSTLLKRGIRAEKTAAGKAGFTLSVDEDQLVQSLEILKENNLPRADYENLGKVFSGQGMISSASEEQARMAYAISQELSDTFPYRRRADGPRPCGARRYGSGHRYVPCLPPPFSPPYPGFACRQPGRQNP